MIDAAAHNNAQWCAVMSRTHAVASEFGEQAWVAATRTPPYYPDAVTLVPGADAAALVAGIDTTVPGASVKDSFADLDLAEAGFQVLFDAQWIHRPASAPIVHPHRAWDVIRDADALRDWAMAWDDGGGHADLFRPALLDDPATFVLAGRDETGRVVAGAVASLSDHVVGVSNVFALGSDPDTAWLVALGALQSLFPTLPVVGYEHGDDLETALRHDFELLGPLRIWALRSPGH